MSRTGVVGLDLSLTSTGVANVDGTTERWRPKKLRGTERLLWLEDRLVDLLVDQRPAMVVLEGYAYGARGRAIFDIGEWGGVARAAIQRLEVPHTIVPPSVLKQFATGKGNADKDAMRLAASQAARRDFDSHDEADAWWLRCVGHLLIGDPLVSPHHRELIGDKVVSWAPTDVDNASNLL